MGDAARDWLIFALCPKSTLSRRGAFALALDANFNHHRGWHFRSILHPLHIIFANARVYKLLIDGIQLLLAQNG